VNKFRKHEVNTLPKKDIELMLEELLEEYENLRFQKVTKQIDNPLILKFVKKDIARLKTIVHEFELGIRKEKSEPTPEEKKKD